MSDSKNWLYPATGIHGTVVHEIGREIVTGILLPGDKLPHESEIIKRFNGSRTAIREAFRVLTAKGLIEAKQRAGTQVRSRKYWNLLDPDVLSWQSQGALSKEDVPDMIEIRDIVEPRIARLAAKSATDQELDTLEGIYQEIETAGKEGNISSFYVATTTFHLTLFKLCHNELVLRLGGIVQSLCDYEFKLNIAHNKIPEDIAESYCAIVTSLRDRDPDGAETTMQTLIGKLSENIQQNSISA